MSIFLGKRSILKNQNIPKIDTSKYLKKDGSDSMLANLDMGNYAIDNLKTYPEGNKNAASKKYVDDETGKLLDLDANRALKGDLSMGDNSIVGIYDISADNSVPSKKFVKDEDKKRDTKITQNANNIATNTTNILSLDFVKSFPKYSHYFHFNYTNPIASFAKNPGYLPSGFPDLPYIFSPDYNDKTKITLIALMIDSDTSVNSNSATLKVEIKLYDDTGGSAYKTLLPETNIGKYRKNSNIFRFNDLSILIKSLDTVNYDDWNGFILLITVSWTNNETRLFFSVDYF